jgi:LuxR family maltose regulon positive regulatory protein
VLARLLLVQGQPGRALALVDRLHTAAVGQERTGSIIETGALRALALAASGRESEAVTVLAGMLTLAGDQGHVRVFADEGPPMAALLGRLIAAQRADQTAAVVPLAFLARLQRAFGDACPVPGTRPVRAAVPGLIEPLTGREMEVLGCWPRAGPTRTSHGNSWSLSTRSRSTSVISWANSAAPTAPRPSPGRGSWT